MVLHTPAFKGICCGDQSKQPLLLPRWMWRVTRTLYLRCCVWVGITVLVKPTFSSGAWVNTCHRARMTQSLEIMMAIQVMG